MNHNKSDFYMGSSHDLVSIRECAVDHMIVIACALKPIYVP